MSSRAVRLYIKPFVNYFLSMSETVPSVCYCKLVQSAGTRVYYVSRRDRLAILLQELPGIQEIEYPEYVALLEGAPNATPVLVGKPGESWGVVTVVPHRTTP